MKSKTAIIVDLDGTLADCSHRVHFVESSPKQWHQFHSSCENDRVNLWCLSIIDSMKTQGIETILLTGRDSKYRDVTKKWLQKNRVSYVNLYMRADGDQRSDSVIKSEVHDLITKDYEVLFCIEDRLSVVKMWRSKGVTCLQCDWGDF